MMTNNRVVYIFLPLFFTILFVSAQEVSLEQEWRDTIAYGIDSKVIELLKTLSERGDTSLAPELTQRYISASNTKLKKEMLDFFNDHKLPQLEQEAIDILAYFYEYDNELIRSSIQYLSSIELSQQSYVLELLQELIAENNTGYSSYAVTAMAELGGRSESEFFVETFKDRTDYIDSIKEGIILGLGTIGDPFAVELLLEILEDDTNPDVQRNYAADSLGKIGDERAVKPLHKVLDEDNNLLRAYAVSALIKFDSEDNSSLLQQALRDSFARTREIALEGVAEANMDSAVPAVKYMAAHDPEASIRRRAVETLAMLGTVDAWEFIFDMVKRDTTPQSLKIIMIDQIIEGNYREGKDVIFSLVTEEWEKKDSRILDAIGRKCSSTSNNELGSLYERLLAHPNFVIQMYAVRGIGMNSMRQYSERIEQLTEEGTHPALKREAENVLDRF